MQAAAQGEQTVQEACCMPPRHAIETGHAAPGLSLAAARNRSIAIPRYLEAGLSRKVKGWCRQDGAAGQTVA
jgi:hypothetical protein